MAMNEKFDERLRGLASVEPPVALDGMEARVLDALVERRTMTRIAGYAAAAALGVGVASAVLPPRAAVAAPVAALWGESAFAPSALLLE